MRVRRVHSVSPGSWYEADTAELNTGLQPSGVHLLLLASRLPPCKTTLPGSPCPTLPVSLPAVPQAHGDPGTWTPPSTDESPKRQVSPKGHAPAMGTAWMCLLHPWRSRCRSAGCRSHWVSVASHIPAARGRGGFPPTRERQLAPVFGGRWYQPHPTGTAGCWSGFPTPWSYKEGCYRSRSCSNRLSTGIPCADSAPCEARSALAKVAFFFASRPGAWDFLPPTSLPPAASGATQPQLCSEPVPTLSVSPLPLPIPLLTHCPSLQPHEMVLAGDFLIMRVFFPSLNNLLKWSILQGLITCGVTFLARTKRNKKSCAPGQPVNP